MKPFFKIIIGVLLLGGGFFLGTSWKTSDTTTISPNDTLQEQSLPPAQKESIDDLAIRKGLNSNELATIKLRFKKPQGKKSSLIAHTISSESVAWEASSANLKWASAIAQFGMTIRGSQYLKYYDYDKVLALAESGLGSDDNGYRDEAIQMMQRMKEIHDPSLSKK